VQVFGVWQLVFGAPHPKNLLGRGAFWGSSPGKPCGLVVPHLRLCGAVPQLLTQDRSRDTGKRGDGAGSTWPGCDPQHQGCTSARLCPPGSPLLPAPSPARCQWGLTLPPLHPSLSAHPPKPPNPTPHPGCTLKAVELSHEVTKGHWLTPPLPRTCFVWRK